MQKPLLVTILAAVILGSYISVTELTTQSIQGPKTLDFPPILTADAAMVDYFLKIEGVPGESTDDKHKDWIEIDSFSWGMSQTGTFASGGGGGAVKVSIQDLMITKTLDKTSPKFYTALASGEHLKSVTVEICKATGNKECYMQYKLTDVMVSSVRPRGSAQGAEDKPMEQVSFNFKTIEWNYQEQKPDGTLGAPVSAGCALGASSPTATSAPSLKTGKIILSEAGSTTFQINVEDETFDVGVTGEGISSLAFNQEERMITLANDGTQGIVEVQIPKELLGGEFTVMANEQEIEFDVSETETDSVLLFDKPTDSSVLTIQGTTVVPEFPIAMIILAATIAVTLFYAVLRRNRLVQKPFLTIIIAAVLLGSYISVSELTTQSTSGPKTLDFPPILTADAMFDAFLKIEGVPGESTDDKHKEWIEVLSFHHGIGQPLSASSSAGAMSAQRADFQSFSIVKSIDKASPKLALACANGEHIKEVNLVLRKAGGEQQEYMVYKLSDVVITSIRPGSAQGTETLPLEEVSFSYGKIEWKYTETDQATGQAKGDIAAGWDLATNKKL